MRLQFLAGALALAGSSAAFSDSAPWVLVSTSTLPDAPNANEIQTSSQVLQHTKNILSSCPTDRYLVISQPGVHAADLNGANGCALPHLCKAVEDSRIKGKFVVSETVGETTKDGLASLIKTACAKKDKSVAVEEIGLAPLSSDRAGSLAKNDGALAHQIEATLSSDSYTVLYVGTGPEPAGYEPQFDEPLRMDLKRAVQGSAAPRREDEPKRDTRPLFEKYQFFTPGIFMALIILIILFAILLVGLRALNSLEVSYGAFSKEMGPAAQKKQQ